MTYALVDTAVQGGRPVELYRFANGSDVWRFCTGDVDQSYNGEVYTAAPIIRGATEASQEFAKSQLAIRVPHDNVVARLFATGYPNGFVTVTVFRSHLGDGQWITHWRGRVVATSWRDADCEFRCEPVFTGLQRPGLRAVYQIQCRHALYSVGCGASKATFGVAGVVNTFVSTEVVVPAAAGYANNHFTLGMLSTAAGSRLIVSHTGSSLTLISPLPTLAAGQAVTLYPGCDHSLQTCEAKFANSINFGGQPWLPTKNPFSGDAIV